MQRGWDAVMSASLSLSLSPSLSLSRSRSGDAQCEERKDATLSRSREIVAAGTPASVTGLRSSFEESQGGVVPCVET